MPGIDPVTPARGFLGATYRSLAVISPFCSMRKVKIDLPSALPANRVVSSLETAKDMTASSVLTFFLAPDLSKR